MIFVQIACNLVGKHSKLLIITQFASITVQNTLPVEERQYKKYILARTLPGILSVRLMLSKILQIHAVMGTRQLCMPRKLQTQRKKSDYISYIGYIFYLVYLDYLLRLEYLAYLDYISYIFHLVYIFYLSNLEYFIYLEYILYLRFPIFANTSCHQPAKPLLQFFCCQTIGSIFQNLQDVIPIFSKYCHNEANDNTEVNLVH